MFQIKREAVVEWLRTWVELVVIVVTVGVLLAFELTHGASGAAKEFPWIEGAMLVVLILVTVAIIRDRRLDNEMKERIEKANEATTALNDQMKGKIQEADERLKDFVATANKALTALLETREEQPGVRWYHDRSAVRDDLLEDIRESTALIFIGIAQTDLARLLGEALASQKTKTLPWKSIEVWFAPSEMGRLFRGDGFEAELRKSRHAVSEIVTNPAHRSQLPHFESLSFQQYRRTLTHGGVMAYKRDVDLDNVQLEEPDVIYVMHSRSSGIVQSQQDGREGLIVRLQSLPRPYRTELHTARIAYYTASCQDIRRNKIALGTIVFDPWDMSVSAWRAYAASSTYVLQESMKCLLDICKLENGDSVLEIGCGPGNLSQLILDRKPEVRLMLLDHSPQMVRTAREEFAGRPNVQLALHKLEARASRCPDLRDSVFSLILFHQSFYEICRTRDAAEDIVRWLSQHLDAGGRIGITLHNLAASAIRPEGYPDWRDDFRQHVEVEVKRIAPDAELRRPGQKAFLTEATVVEVFKEAGFEQLAEPLQRTFRMTLSERKSMWEVPAIMNNLVDVNRLGVDNIVHVTEKAVAAMGVDPNAEQMPRVVRFLVFGKATPPAA